MKSERGIAIPESGSFAQIIFPPGPTSGPRGIGLVRRRAPIEMPQREDQSPELGPEAKIGQLSGCLSPITWTTGVEVIMGYSRCPRVSTL